MLLDVLSLNLKNYILLVSRAHEYEGTVKRYAFCWLLKWPPEE
jgi:hypothetical protein